MEISPKVSSTAAILNSEYVYNLFIYYKLEEFKVEYICTVALQLSGLLKYPYTQGGKQMTLLLVFMLVILSRVNMPTMSLATDSPRLRRARRNARRRY
jgi:hypothetical protein